MVDRLQRQHGESGIQYYEGGEWWTGFRDNMVSRGYSIIRGQNGGMQCRELACNVLGTVLGVGTVWQVATTHVVAWCAVL